MSNKAEKEETVDNHQLHSAQQQPEKGISFSAAPGKIFRQGGVSAPPVILSPAIYSRDDLKKNAAASGGKAKKIYAAARLLQEAAEHLHAAEMTGAAKIIGGQAASLRIAARGEEAHEHALLNVPPIDHVGGGA